MVHSPDNSNGSHINLVLYCWNLFIDVRPFIRSDPLSAPRDHGGSLRFTEMKKSKKKKKKNGTADEHR
jgi:hypothetical protein